jgi:epoxyqueuosine reductase QueG
MKLEKKFLNELGIVDYAYTEEAKASSFNKFNQWLEKNWNGPLSYLAGDRGDKRADLKLFWPEFQSALVFLFSYKIIRKKLLDDSNLNHNIYLI